MSDSPTLQFTPLDQAPAHVPQAAPVLKFAPLDQPLAQPTSAPLTEADAASGDFANQQAAQQTADKIPPPKETLETMVDSPDIHKMRENNVAAAGFGADMLSGEAGAGLAKDAVVSLVKKIPSAERAGKVMNTLREAIGSHPVEMTNELSKATARAQELADNGNTMSAALRKFVNRVTDPEKGHLTYNEGRDFLTKFGSMTADEATKIAPTMKAQIQTIAGELKDAIGATAKRGGMLEEFQNSMKEYRQAASLNKAKELLKDYATKGVVKAAIGGAAGVAGGAAGYELYNKLKELFP